MDIELIIFIGCMVTVVLISVFTLTGTDYGTELNRTFNIEKAKIAAMNNKTMIQLANELNRTFNYDFCLEYGFPKGDCTSFVN